MSADYLPFVVSVPHGGDQCPAELAERTELLAHDVFEDSDAFTNRIYNVTGSVAHIEIASIARAYVDLNRAPDDLPPENPDGVVKSATDQAVPVYAAGLQPGPALIGTLLARYHSPYHAALSAAASRSDVRVGLDCHSMEPYPPPIAPDSNGARPTFCLSNGCGQTCPDWMLEALGDALSRAFGVERARVTHNRPFEGGWTIRHHAEADGIPWVQVEMNRALYLGPPWFDESRLRVADERIKELNALFLGALERFSSMID